MPRVTAFKLLLILETWPRGLWIRTADKGAPPSQECHYGTLTSPSRMVIVNEGNGSLLTTIYSWETFLANFSTGVICSPSLLSIIVVTKYYIMSN